MTSNTHISHQEVEGVEERLYPNQTPKPRSAIAFGYTEVGNIAQASKVMQMLDQKILETANLKAFLNCSRQ